jgi:hypothetical protein
LGPRCFGPRIRSEPFPPKFSITKHIKAYNCEVKLHTWLQDYAMTIAIANRNSRIACKFLPVMLEGAAHIWIDSLPPNSINCWKYMKDAFTHNFEGTYKRPYIAADLARCRQKPDETSRDFPARWITINNACEGIHEVQAIDYFTEGLVQGTTLRHYLKRVNPTTLAEMISIAS